MNITDYWMLCFRCALQELDMTHFLHTDADLQAGLAQLIVADPRLKPIAEKAGAFSLRRREEGFPGLCAIVCGQQLSTASAAAIRARLFATSSIHFTTTRSDWLVPTNSSGSVCRLQNQIDPGNRQSGGQGPHRSDRGREHGGQIRPMPHRVHGIDHGLPIFIFCSASARRCVSFRRSLRSRSSARIAFGLRKRPDPGPHKMARPGVRGEAWPRIYSGPIICGEEAERGAGSANGRRKAGRQKDDKREKEEWLNSMARGSSRVPDPRANWWFSCMATALMAMI
jgi:hypothetical protein